MKHPTKLVRDMIGHNDEISDLKTKIARAKAINRGIDATSKRLTILDKDIRNLQKTKYTNAEIEQGNLDRKRMGY